MEKLGKNISRMETISDVDKEIFNQIPVEHRARVLEIFGRLREKIRMRQFSGTQDFVSFMQLMKNLDSFSLFFEEMIFFDEVEGKINNIPGPKKAGKKLTHKGIFLKEFQDFKKQIERTVFGDGYLRKDLKSDYQKFMRKIPDYKKYNESREIQRSENKQYNAQKESSYQKPVVIDEKNKNNQPRDISLFLDKLSRRIDTISQRGNHEDYIDELYKMLENIEDKEKTSNKCEEKINSIKENVNELIEMAKESSSENVFGEEKFENENIIEDEKKEKKVEKIDNFSGTRYEEFMRILLSIHGFHYSVSSTKNPSFKNSKGDGSFASKIARPLFHKIEELFLSGVLNPDNLSWKEVVENIEKNSVMKPEVTYFMNVLCNFKNKGSIIHIMSDFLLAMEKFSETNYYGQDSRENLVSMQMRICDILKNF